MKRFGLCALFLLAGFSPATPDTPKSPAEPTPAPAATKFQFGQVRQRIAADRFLRRLERDGKLTDEQMKAVRKVRNNNESFQDFIAGVQGIDGASKAFADDDGSTPFLDWLTTVGKWMWEHREEILKFILQIVDLFTWLELHGYTFVFA